MPLEPIKQELLIQQRDVLLGRVTPQMVAARYLELELPLQLARFAEAHAINEGNRQIEALQPKKFKLPSDITVEDARRMRLELRSKLYSYFIWHFPADYNAVRIRHLADEALLAVETVLSNHQLQEE